MSNNPLGKLGHVGIAPQTDFNTPVAAVDYLKFTSESLQLKIDEILETSQQGIGDEPVSYAGAGTVAGNTVHEVHPVGLGLLMRSWAGQPRTIERPAFVVTATNKFLDFDIGSTELVATVVEGTYLAGATQSDAGTFCKALYDAIVAAEAVGSYTVSFSTTTKLFTVTRSAGSIQFNFKTGTHGSDNLNTSIATLLGFVSTADTAQVTGPATLTGTVAAPLTYQHTFTPPAYAIPTARRGIATAGGVTSLTDNAQSAAWAINQWKGWWLHVYEGTGSGQYMPIISNTTTVLTWTATMVAPSTDSYYEILPGPENSILPPYTIEVHRDIHGSAAAFQYQGLVANSLAFKFSPSTKILELTAGWLGKDCLNIAKTAPVLPTTEPFKWSQAKVGIGTYASGTATGSPGTSKTVITNSGASFTVDALIGKLVLKLNSDGTKSEVRPITDNDATTITVSPGFVDFVAATDTYEVFNCPDIAESVDFTLNNGLAALPTLNYSSRISRIVGDVFRAGTATVSVIPQDIADYSTYYVGWTTRRWLIWFKGQQVTGNHYHEIAFLFPKVLFTAYPVNIGGAGRIMVAIAAKLKYDSTYGYMVKGWLNTERVSFSA